MGKFIEESYTQKKRNPLSYFLSPGDGEGGCGAWGVGAPFRSVTLAGDKDLSIIQVSVLAGVVPWSAMSLGCPCAPVPLLGPLTSWTWPLSYFTSFSIYVEILWEVMLAIPILAYKIEAMFITFGEGTANICLYFRVERWQYCTSC